MTDFECYCDNCYYCDELDRCEICEKRKDDTFFNKGEIPLCSLECFYQYMKKIKNSKNKRLCEVEKAHKTARMQLHQLEWWYQTRKPEEDIIKNAVREAIRFKIYKRERMRIEKIILSLDAIIKKLE